MSFPVDMLDKLCLASTDEEGNGNLRVSAAVVKDKVLLTAIKLMIASHRMKKGNRLSNGDSKYSLRWKDGELTSVQTTDEVLITADKL